MKFWTTPGPSGIFIDSAGGEHSYYTGGDLCDAINQMYEWNTIAVTNDEIEAQNAVANLPRECLGMGAKKWDQTKTEAGWNFVSMAAGETLKWLSDLMRRHYFPNADKPIQMSNTLLGWKSVESRLAVVESQLSSLSLADWLGNSGSSYRDTIPHRKGKVQQLEALSASTANSLEGVALLQISVSAAIMNTFASALSPHSYAITKQPIYNIAANWSEADFYNHVFYKRSRQLQECLAFIYNAVNGMGAPTGVWAPSAQGVADNLTSATDLVLAGVAPTASDHGITEDEIDPEDYDFANVADLDQQRIQG